MDEAAQYVHPGVAAPYLLPQIRGAVAVRVRRIACAEFVAPVERQEPRLGAGQAGGHRHRRRIDREVHHAGPAQGPVAWGAVVAVLGDGVLDGLARVGALEFGGGHRYAVDEQCEVDGLVAGGIEGQLSGDRQHVGFVAFRQFWCEAVGWFEVREPDCDVAVHYSIAQHVHGASPVEFGCQPLHEPRLRLVGIASVGRVH